ncbi:MAG: hypothetical protein ACLTTJ_05000 [Blautia sp.]
MPYMIHTMTDETYAINLTLESKDWKKKIPCFGWRSFPDVIG